MNVDSKNEEPVTDLKLGLGTSNQCIETRSSSGSGAGANAGDFVDMAFMATDPLSELVWSPKNGLSLKCADCSLAGKKPSLLLAAGSSNMVISQSQSNIAGRLNTEKPVEEEILISQLENYAKNTIAVRDTLAVSSRSDVGFIPLYGSNHDHGTGETNADAAQYGPPSGDPICGCREIEIQSSTSRVEVVLSSQVQPREQCQAYDTQTYKNDEKSTSLVEKESNDVTKKADYPTVIALRKLESTAENDLGTANEILTPEFAREVEKSEQDKKVLSRGKTIPDEHSPTNSQLRKGKAKALSDGDVKIKMSEDDDSHESVESCNAGLFSMGRKRRSFNQQCFGGSKRLRKEIQETPGSSYFAKHDSSFMNWISNMVTGFFKSNQNEAPSVTLGLSHPNNRRENLDQNLITCHKSRDPAGGNMGFQSIFQSLYCPKPKDQEIRTLNDNFHGGNMVDSVCDINATPISCGGKNDSFCNAYLPSNDKFNSASGSKEGPQTQSKFFPLNLASGDKNSQINSIESKKSYHLAIDTKKHEMSSNTSQNSRTSNSADNIDRASPSDVKKAHNLSSGGNPLESLWITRFIPKTSSVPLNLDTSNQSTGGAPQDSGDAMRLIPCSQNVVNCACDLKIVQAKQYSIEDPLIIEHKELQICSVNSTQAAHVFNRSKGHPDQKSPCKLDWISASASLKNSEAMASVFARRLDALKHIMQSGMANNAACATIGCLFCGRFGHHLQDCPEISDTELKELLRSTNLFNALEEPPCLCIRCFQPNHWAVACPSGPSRGRLQSECVASLVNDRNPEGLELNGRHDVNSKLLDDKQSQLQAAGSQSVYIRKEAGVKANINLSWKINESTRSDRIVCSTNLVNKNIESTSGEIKLKENKVMPSCGFVKSQTLDVPKGIFDAVRMLRLSRTDILKCMNSQASVSNLDGFFLRLRLGKWEEGLGGTGYYVACITGVQRKSLSSNSRSSLSVNIGGIKCLVESQYISNHDFLEDELMAWCRATMKNGDNLPSEEKLRLKLKERKLLGL